MSHLPGIVAAIAGDATQNLRTALDHLAYQLLIVHVGDAFPDKEFQFPIRDTATEYKSVLNSTLSDQILASDHVGKYNVMVIFHGV
jgi:hypothetical protein